MIIDKQNYQETDQGEWQGRADPTRLYQTVECRSLKDSFPSPGISLLGFRCDQGVARNQGRVGAKDGPQALRKQLGSLAIHHPSLVMYDAGNILALGSLEQAQQALGQAVAYLQSQDQLTIVLGGGHETAWGHFQGLAKQPFAQDLAIINFDAHFDLRHEQQSTSGTPFFQIHEQCQKQSLPFHYYCFGIQPQANTDTLFKTAKTVQAQYWLAQDIHIDPNHLVQEIDIILNRHQSVYVSVCLDVFSSAFAPGVSAPSPLGLLPWHVLPVMKRLAQSSQVKAMDVVELAPNYDDNQFTAKLGAQIIHHFVENL